MGFTLNCFRGLPANRCRLGGGRRGRGVFLCEGCKINVLFWQLAGGVEGFRALGAHKVERSCPSWCLPIYGLILNGGAFLPVTVGA